MDICQQCCWAHYCLAHLPNHAASPRAGGHIILLNIISPGTVGSGQSPLLQGVYYCPAKRCVPTSTRQDGGGPQDNAVPGQDQHGPRLLLASLNLCNIEYPAVSHISILCRRDGGGPQEHAVPGRDQHRPRLLHHLPHRPLRPQLRAHPPGPPLRPVALPLCCS